MARAPRKTQSEIDAEAEAAEAARDDLPRYRVMERSFIGHTLVEDGAEITHDVDDDSEIGENLSPLNDAAQAVIDAQKGDHPDKTPKDGAKPHRKARARADAASAGVGAASDEEANELA